LDIPPAPPEEDNDEPETPRPRLFNPKDDE
jgi:hypothetical protein